MSPVIAVIGAGNMGSCLIGGLVNNGHPANKIWACGPSAEKLQDIKHRFGVQTSTDNKQAAQTTDIIILAVKPQVLPSVAKELAPIIQMRKPLVISVVTGIREESIRQQLGAMEAAIVRAMPNTPALIGSGATGLFANSYVTHEERNIAESILRSVGLVVWLPEERLLDTVTALSGSGPAYFFLVMEALQEAAEQQGLAPNVARLLTLQTALGAAKMALECEKSLVDLRKNVTSPGGTTEKAISVLEEHNIRSIFKKAVQAAKLRAEELGS